MFKWLLCNVNKEIEAEKDIDIVYKIQSEEGKVVIIDFKRQSPHSFNSNLQTTLVAYGKRSEVRFEINGELISDPYQVFKSAIEYNIWQTNKKPYTLTEEACLIIERCRGILFVQKQGEEVKVDKHLLLNPRYFVEEILV